METVLLEFQSEKIQSLEYKISQELETVVKKIIEEHSPVQVGNIVESYCGMEKTTMKITQVQLLASWNSTEKGDALSFHYSGIACMKNGKPIPERKEQPILSFTFNNIRYNTPGYSRIKFTKPQIRKLWE